MFYFILQLKKLVLFAFKGKRPRGRPKKLLKQENQSGSNDSDANDLLNEGNTHAKFQLHSDQETAAAEILLGMSEVG